MYNNKWLLVWIIAWLLPTIACGQTFELTSEGLRSSSNLSANYIEYLSLGKSKTELYDFCDHKLGYGMDFFSYQMTYIPQSLQIQIEGSLEGSSLLVFGKTEIHFAILLECNDNGIKVEPQLSKTNGKPLNYGILFNKKGNARMSSTKNKIETEINALIYKIIGEVVDIRK